MRSRLSHFILPLTVLLGGAPQPAFALLGLNLDLGDLLGLNLGLGLLEQGALININAFADIASANSKQCSTGQTIGVSTSLLGLVKVCACVNLLNLGGRRNPNACPECPLNAAPVCGDTKCACACKSDFFADANGVCVPRSTCAPPNVITPLSQGIKSTCTCAAGFRSNGMGGCVLAASGRARLARSLAKRVVPAHAHAARPAPGGHKKAARNAKGLVDQSQKSGPTQPTCPGSEIACPLSSGGFECLDVTSSLVSCGGCVGEGLPGRNCLAIPGALNVQCADSTCHIASCFKGYRFKNGKCIKLRTSDSMAR